MSQDYSWLFLFSELQGRGKQQGRKFAGIIRDTINAIMLIFLESKLLSQQIASLCSRTANKMKVKIKEDRRGKGITHLGEEQGHWRVFMSKKSLL